MLLPPPSFLDESRTLPDKKDVSVSLQNEHCVEFQQPRLTRRMVAGLTYGSDRARVAEGRKRERVRERREERERDKRQNKKSFCQIPQKTAKQRTKEKKEKKERMLQMTTTHLTTDPTGGITGLLPVFVK